MKKVLSILLINLIFVFVYSQIVDNSDLPNELLNDREIQKYIKSFEKFKRYFRSLDDTSESNEDSEESSGEESNELSSGDESNDVSSGEESSGSEETGTSADTTTSTQNIDTDTSSGNQTISPTETPTPTPTPTPVPSPNYGYNSINILLFSNYQTRTYTSLRPVVITFTLYIVYRGYTPFSRVTFTLRLAFMLFRGLQE